MNAEDRKKIQTVLGLIDAKDLGVTLVHDHVLIDRTFMYAEPEEISQKGLAHQKITLENRGWVGYHWTSNLNNVELKDEELAVSELKRFVAAGSRGIIDPTNVGLGRDPKSPLEIIEEVGKAGGDLSRTIICHIDRTCLEREWLNELASSGCYLEYDLFGNESSYYPPNPDVDMPSDAQRMDVILWHFEHGYEKQVLLSHDVATKHRLQAYGGLGYDHLITNVVPRLRKRGLSEDLINSLAVENLARVYSFV